jgi:hypothetical protein
MKLIDCVKGNAKFVKFDCTEGKEPAIWYICENGFVFPIPLSEMHGAEFNAEDKATYFMRWIRPQLELIKSAMSE